MNIPDDAEETLHAELRRIAASDHLLVALDFDGTLAPLQDVPLDARMLPEAAAAVEALTTEPGVTVAFVSGRSLVDLRHIAEHRDDSPIYLAASHGAEYWLPGEGPREPVEDEGDVALRDELRAHAESLVSKYEGVWIEPKTFGFAVHTRLTDAATAARADAEVDDLVAAEAPSWRRRTGRNIVEYAFRDEGKDTAVRTLRELTHADAVLYAGDDVTDEDALGSLGPGDLGILVGDRPSAARVRVDSIPKMASALELLAQERRRARI
ncbi:trehalose-phosphatase [Microbacterium immunditiarum]|uniref:Trehalose 6-phosphate phosphatase n=1 Tax=Microbacterium immunditiarum TaxID=337480 RepID=A0A7Y9GPA7_9MICO|nr:trehalose 6-phosphate phosphatase [Microbacterium immunditiarum]